MDRTTITETRLKKWIKSGRGFGFFESYKPWIQISRQDHGSHGYSHQTPNPFSGRTHHLLSNLEKAIFRMSLAHIGITDNREQFPIWPEPHLRPLAALREHLGEPRLDDEPDTLTVGSLAIAKRHDIHHASYVGLKRAYIYTTDQLLTVQLGNSPARLIAIAIKYTSELRGHRQGRTSSSPDILRRNRRATFQKLRLEREYWRNQNIPWLLLTERQTNPCVIKNLEWGHSSWQQRLPTPAEWEYLKRLRRKIRLLSHDRSCKDTLEDFARPEGISFESTVRLFKLGIICGLLPVDLSHPISLMHAIPMLQKHTDNSLPSWSHLRAAWRPT